MKPACIVVWEKKCEQLRKQIPKVCKTCEFHVEEASALYCRRYESSPPLEFQETEAACQEWRSVLDEIPF